MAVHGQHGQHGQDGQHGQRGQHGQHGAPARDPVVQLFTEAIVDAVASHAASSRREVADAVRAEAERIASESAALAVDAAGHRWLALCSVLLAAYRTLLPLAGGSPAAVSVLQSAMTAPFRARIKAFMNERFGISQDAPEDAFDRIAETFQSRGQQRFGGAFTFVTDVRDGERSFTNIERCLFNDFFRANDASELTVVCCAMDDVWAEELAHPRYRVRFERPTTLAAGDDACRFRFFRASDASATTATTARRDNQSRAIRQRRAGRLS